MAQKLIEVPDYKKHRQEIVRSLASGAMWNLQRLSEDERRAWHQTSNQKLNKHIIECDFQRDGQTLKLSLEDALGEWLDEIVRRPPHRRGLNFNISLHL